MDNKGYQYPNETERGPNSKYFYARARGAAKGGGNVHKGNNEVRGNGQNFRGRDDENQNNGSKFDSRKRINKKQFKFN